jgi:TfoX/Sxy family transcriptional regulator of competence genes
MGETTSYELVAHELLADPAVKAGKLFGHPCLKVGGKVFACEHEGELLAKLPLERIAQLKAAGAHEFAPMGRPMGGWVKIPEPEDDVVPAWTNLAEEAKAFVADAL